MSCELGEMAPRRRKIDGKKKMAKKLAAKKDEAFAVMAGGIPGRFIKGTFLVILRGHSGYGLVRLFMERAMRRLRPTAVTRWGGAGGVLLGKFELR